MTMDPVSTAIVAALSSGAVALANSALSEAGKEAYTALKNAVMGFVSPSDIEKLEQRPLSESRRSVLAEELCEAGKDKDPELAELARALLAALKAEGATSGATGVALEEVEAINIRLQRIAASGSGATLKKVKARGDIEVTDVTAGGKA